MIGAKCPKSLVYINLAISVCLSGCHFACVSDHGSQTPSPICLKFWFRNSFMLHHYFAFNILFQSWNRHRKERIKLNRKKKVMKKAKVEGRKADGWYFQYQNSFLISLLLFLRFKKKSKKLLLSRKSLRIHLLTRHIFKDLTSFGYLMRL